MPQTPLAPPVPVELPESWQRVSAVVEYLFNWSVAQAQNFYVADESLETI